MSTRNIVWLAAVVVVGAIVWISAGPWWGLVAAVATLVLSEAVERAARKRRRGGAPGPSLRDAVTTRRRPR